MKIVTKLDGCKTDRAAVRLRAMIPKSGPTRGTNDPAPAKAG
jgi:hypothetical protein